MMGGGVHLLAVAVKGSKCCAASVTRSTQPLVITITITITIPITIAVVSESRSSKRCVGKRRPLLPHARASAACAAATIDGNSYC